jgi:hypothetical protein
VLFRGFLSSRERSGLCRFLLWMDGLILLSVLVIVTIRGERSAPSISSSGSIMECGATELQCVFFVWAFDTDSSVAAKTSRQQMSAPGAIHRAALLCSCPCAPRAMCSSEARFVLCVLSMARAIAVVSSHANMSSRPRCPHGTPNIHPVFTPTNQPCNHGNIAWVCVSRFVASLCRSRKPPNQPCKCASVSRLCILCPAPGRGSARIPRTRAARAFQTTPRFCAPKRLPWS